MTRRNTTPDTPAVQLPPDVYEPATWDTTIKACEPGTELLIARLQAAGFGHAGCYADRQVPNSGGAPSTHREGRAIDLSFGDRSFDEMTSMVESLAMRAEMVGVQQIIFNLRLWRVGVGWVPYDGAAGDHKDHAHIELTRAAAASLSPELIREAFGDPEPPEPLDPNDNGDETMPPTLYRDEALANVFAIFPSGEVLHVSGDLAEHYVSLGSPPVVVGRHSPQTIASLFAKAGLDQNGNAVNA